MDYNVPGGKLNRGMSVVDSVAILKGRDLTESEYFKAAVLGWSVEYVRLFQFHALLHPTDRTL
jgi:farnesyl diphosphate synthase